MGWDFYWRRHLGGPFATLIRIATTCLHPEESNPEALRQLAKREDRPEMRGGQAECSATKRSGFSDPAAYSADQPGPAGFLG